MNELNELFEQLDEAAYDRMVTWFDQVREDNRVFFTGQGRSGLVARMAAMRLMHLGLESYFVGESTAPSIEGGDLLFALSGSGRTPVTLNFVRVAKGAGAQVALLTQTERSPVREIADQSLVLPAGHTQQFGGTLFEEAALIVLDAIVRDQGERRNVPRSLMARRHTNFV